MQNNVKRVLIDLGVSLTVFIVLFVLLCLPGDAADPIAVGNAPSSKFTTHTENGVTYVGEREFTVTDYTVLTACGQPASVSVGAERETDVSITVYYNSGASQSSVFSPKTAYASEDAVWEWKIPVNSSTERVRVVLRSESCYAELYVNVLITH